MSDYVGSNQKTAGELLKETRESKGIALLTVHEATKMPLDVLKAIEEGYSVRTLSPFYLKGFVKMYAEYLGVDVAKVMERPVPVLQKALKPTKPKIKMVEEKTYAMPEDEFDLGSLIGKERQKQIVLAIGALLFLFGIVRMVGCVVSIRSQSKSTPAVVKPAAVETVSPRKVAEEKLVVPAASASEKKKAPAAAQAVSVKESDKPVKKETDSVRLTIKVKKGGWLQVKVDGNVVMESTVKAGTVETWEAKREIVISGRTIHNLEFELNGKMLGTLGRQDRNARRVVVTRQGLAVKG